MPRQALRCLRHLFSPLSLQNMELKLVRDQFTDKSTTGQLSIDGSFFSFTLELPTRDGLPGSAIPEGKYQVVASWSPKFGRTMPLIIGIPGRSEIRIHYGNDAVDTEGCILLGKTRSQDWIGSSREAFDEFWPRFMQSLAEGVPITISSQSGEA